MRRLIAVVAAAAALIALAVPAAASDNMNNWHIHDGGSDPGHASIPAFFLTVLGLTEEEYLDDPAVCPNATDKVLLGPDGLDGNQVVRSGICMTSKYVIQLRTQDSSRPAPALASGWKLGLAPTTEGGPSTYVRLTALR